MENVNVAPAPRRSRAGLSSFWIKLAAIAGMTSCHTAVVFQSTLPFAWYCILMAFGGMTFPIMAFMLTEGFRYTSSLPRYALRLGLVALIAQAPFSLVLCRTSTDPLTISLTLNVLFTLLAGLGMLTLIRLVRSRTLSPNTTLNTVLRVLAIGAIVCLAVVLTSICDWDQVGVLIIFGYYILQDPLAGTAALPILPHTSADPHAAQFRARRFAVIITLGILVAGMTTPAFFRLIAGNVLYLPNVLYFTVGTTLAAVLLCAYNGEPGRLIKKTGAQNAHRVSQVAKWAFYLYYPLHIIILGLLR